MNVSLILYIVCYCLPVFYMIFISVTSVLMFVLFSVCTCTPSSSLSLPSLPLPSLPLLSLLSLSLSYLSLPSSLPPLPLLILSLFSSSLTVFTVCIVYIVSYNIHVNCRRYCAVQVNILVLIIIFYSRILSCLLQTMESMKCYTSGSK